MVEVSGLIDPRMLVEIELVAYRGSPPVRTGAVARASSQGDP